MKYLLIGVAAMVVSCISCSTFESSRATSNNSTPTASPVSANTAPEVKERVVTFDGTEYELASVIVGKNTITNEYVPKGETLSNWTTLIGVREFQVKDEPRAVVLQYLASIKPVIYREPEFLMKDGTEPFQDVTVVLQLKSAKEDYIEYNLHRFFKSKNGVTAYQFAQKIPDAKKSDAEILKREIGKESTRVPELSKLTIPVYTSK